MSDERKIYSVNTPMGVVFVDENDIAVSTWTECEESPQSEE